MDKYHQKCSAPLVTVLRRFEMEDSRAGAHMCPDPDGDWVEYDVAAKIKRERDEARRIAEEYRIAFEEAGFFPQAPITWEQNHE